MTIKSTTINPLQEYTSILKSYEKLKVTSLTIPKQYIGLTETLELLKKQQVFLNNHQRAYSKLTSSLNSTAKLNLELTNSVQSIFNNQNEISLNIKNAVAFSSILQKNTQILNINLKNLLSQISEVTTVFNSTINHNQSFFRTSLALIDQIKGLDHLTLAEIATELDDQATELNEEDFIQTFEREISNNNDYNSLSTPTKSQIYTRLIYLIIIVASFVGDVTSNVIANLITTQIQERTNISNTKNLTRQSIKTIQKNIDSDLRDLLKGYRVVTTNLLHFRVAPNVHSEILEVLSEGTLLKVIDKSDRSWLLVEVEINGGFEQGWVFRRYTTYFK